MTLTVVGLDWQDRARCANVRPDAFFPDDGKDTRRARAMCARCPVWQECLNYGIDEVYGVWGGLDRAGRNRLRRLRHRLAVAPNDPGIAKDIRLLVLAGMSPERLGRLLDISAETIAGLARRRKAS